MSKPEGGKGQADTACGDHRKKHDAGRLPVLKLSGRERGIRRDIRVRELNTLERTLVVPKAQTQEVASIEARKRKVWEVVLSITRG